jgi:predicted regulator of Ras-like GTPase activity (Roadblock/LC7/MglB family)
MKGKMFGYVKNLLRKWVETPDGKQSPPAVNPAPAPARRIVLAPPPEGAPVRQNGSRQNGSHQNGSHQNGKGIELPLQPIIGGLPLDLQPRLKRTEAAGLTISIPLEKILAQLSHGVVKITFGELRQAAPDFFTPERDRDRVLVPLPLGDILARLNPALITRRRVQKQVEVPDDISSPFDQRNPALIFSVGPSNPEAAPTPTPAPAPAARQTVVPTPAPLVPPSRSGITFAPTPPPPTIAPQNSPAMNSATRALHEFRNNPAPLPPRPAIKMAPATSTAPEPSGSTDSSPLLVGLTSLAESWPEAVRQELVQLSLLDAKVALPAEIVERALKQGRVAFTWKTLRSWIKPTPLPTVSVHDSVVLELPLKVVAPPFLARQREVAKSRKKVSVDADIPNLFFGFPRSEASSPTVASAASPGAGRPEETNFYVWDDTNEQVRPRENETKVEASPGTKFVAKYATPNEVVSRAAALDGVVGALIALPDGLMVASRLSPDLNGDTLAAFLPQIFGKVNQCTKELRMGELNNVNFTVGNVPWKIFRVNAIFFAAFGRAGEPLPTAHLAALATELDHKPK